MYNDGRKSKINPCTYCPTCNNQHIYINKSCFAKFYHNLYNQMKNRFNDFLYLFLHIFYHHVVSLLPFIILFLDDYCFGITVYPSSSIDEINYFSFFSNVISVENGIQKGSSQFSMVKSAKRGLFGRKGWEFLFFTFF